VPNDPGKELNESASAVGRPAGMKPMPGPIFPLPAAGNFDLIAWSKWTSVAKENKLALGV
jgi:hypothetical protein